MSKGFTIGGALKAGWNGMKKNFFLFGFLVLLSFIFTKSHLALSDHLWVYHVGLGIVSFVINILIAIGLVTLSLVVAKGEKPTFGTIFTKFHTFLRFLVASILYGIIVFIGLVLFIIPGIYWGTKYWLYPYFIIDQEAGIIDSLKRSSETTKGFKWDVLGLIIIILLLNVLGTLALLVGLFVTIPIGYIAQAYAYVKLQEAQTPPSQQTDSF